MTAGVFYPAVWHMVKQARPGWLGDPFDERFPPIQNCLLDSCVLPPPEDRGIDNLWPVDADLPLQGVADKVLRALDDHALPWLLRNAELKATLKDLTELSRKGVWLSSVFLLCAAAVTRERTIAEQALGAVLSAKSSKFFPDSERNAFKAIAATAGVGTGEAGDAA